MVFRKLIRAAKSDMTSERASAHSAWQAGLLACDIRTRLPGGKPPVTFESDRACAREGHLQRRVRGGFSPPSLTPATTEKHISRIKSIDHPEKNKKNKTKSSEKGRLQRARY
jgi:hypothetical protein